MTGMEELVVVGRSFDMPLMRHYIDVAIAKSGRDPEVVVGSLRDDARAFGAWAVDDDGVMGGAVFEVAQDKDRRILHCVAFGTENGALDRIGDWIRAWEGLALDNGCRWLSLRGRFGWERVMKSRGFVRRGDYLEKDVES